MKRFNLKMAALSAALAAVYGVASAADLAGDYSTASNPGNGWTYGFNDTAVGGGHDVANDVVFALFHPNNEGNAGDRWTGDGTGDTAYPPNDFMLVNLGAGHTEGNHWGGGQITWEEGVSYHTWGNNELSGGINGLSADDTIYSTFTVPNSGLYDITGAWTENGNSGGADVTVLVNGVSIGAGSVDLDTEGDAFTVESLGLSLTAGDSVSFRTTRHTDYAFGGSARLDASVVAIPEPASVVVAGLAVVCLTTGSRRRSRIAH